MGVRTIIGEDGYQVLYCSTTMQAFGPVFYEDDDVDAFLEWLPKDAREYTNMELYDKVHEWRTDILNETHDPYLGDGNFADNH